MAESFRCLAIETATEHCSVAAINCGALSVKPLSSSRESAREVYSAIEQSLDDVALSLEQLDCIAFGCGPGSFTGLRIAAGVAQGLAYSRSLPVCRISTLAALACVAGMGHEHQYIAACLDARMGEAYFGLYQRTLGHLFQAVQPDRLLSPESIRLESVPGGWLAAGAGWALWPDLASRCSAEISTHAAEVWPDAGAVLKLAEHEFVVGNTVSPDAALPNYIRDQVTG